MKKVLYIFFIVSSLLSIEFLSPLFVNIAKAETIIEDSTINTDTQWIKEKSPYIISGTIFITNNAKLNIAKGVSIVGRKIDPDNPPFIVMNSGSIVMDGVRGERIYVSNLYGISIRNSTFIANRTDFSNMDRMDFENSEVQIATSTFSDFKDAFHVKNIEAKISGSIFNNIPNGIIVDSMEPPHLMVDNSHNIGGIGNALDTASTSYRIVINNSSITNNSYCAFCNFSSDIVMAQNNWWGNSSGPNVESDTNNISGLVSYEPWSTSQPVFDPEDKEICCSSILFLPGLEGTRLFVDENSTIGSNINRLWEPNRNDDVRKLFLTGTGSSTNPNIWSNEPIDNIFGLKDIYGNFSIFLNDLVLQGLVNEWKAFGYDWRKPITEVVAGIEKRATTTESLINTVKDLASRSKTNKVTIVAHSNGGLVAKYLVKVLDEMKQANIIDKVISVAVPYLGTPQAVAGLLHGDSQSIAQGIILKQSVARQLGINMASAYTLLPGLKYFSQIFSPSIVFASSTISGLNNGSYSQNITSSEEQNNFIADIYNNRIGSSSNINIPAKGNKLLLTSQNIVRNMLDNYIWPVNIVRYAISGWNKDTMKNIVYSKGKKCTLFLFCKDTITYTASTTNMGDGTVVVPSATYDSDNQAVIDLQQVSDTEGKIGHANILHSSTTQGLIKYAVTNNQKDEWCNKVNSIKGVSCSEPDYSKGNGSIIVSTHSPVELHIYDEENRHTGSTGVPNSLDEKIEDDIVSFYEENIPGSTFRVKEVGEDDTETYITIPDNGKKYNIEVKGIALGTFTMDIDRQIWNGTNIGHAEFNNIPVNPLTKAIYNLQLNKPDTNTNSSTTNAELKKENLRIDFDGDNNIDANVISNNEPSYEFNKELFLESMRKTITTLMDPKSNKTKNYLNKFKLLDNLLRKEKTNKVEQLSSVLSKKIGHIKLKGISAENKQKIIDLIDEFLANIE